MLIGDLEEGNVTKHTQQVKHDSQFLIREHI